MNIPDRIDKFDGEYAFLSNFYECLVHFDGLLYQNSEAAFQAQKCVCASDRSRFMDLPPNKAKRLGRKVLLRPDWEDVKDDVMYRVVLSKFLQNPSLADALIKTGNAELIEGSYWGDTCWGVCEGVGQNKLGEILMRVRSELPHLTRKIFDINT